MDISLSDISSKLTELEAEAKSARSVLKAEREQLAAAKSEALDTEEAQKVLQIIAESVQKQVHDRIAGIVTRCLETVFIEDAYEFKINFEQKRGRTEAALSFTRDDLSIDPLTSSGGGVIDVAALALRLSTLLLRRPVPRRLLILDEPFRFVSKEYRERVRELLEELSKELKLQIVMVTHIEEFRIGTVIEIE